MIKHWFTQIHPIDIQITTTKPGYLQLIIAEDFYVNLCKQCHLILSWSCVPCFLPASVFLVLSSSELSQLSFQSFPLSSQGSCLGRQRRMTVSSLLLLQLFFSGEISWKQWKMEKKFVMKYHYKHSRLELFWFLLV